MSLRKLIAIDLFCGLGGWTEGLLAEGYRVIGFDIKRHDYGDGKRYPAQLVLQDVMTIHGSQFKDAVLIVASPPCHEFSYMAMPWTLAKEKQRRIESDAAERKRLTALFDACFRIQREACEAAGRHIPMVVENVRGAQKWVGRSRWNFGSFHLWGDVPALMPIARKHIKVKTIGHINKRDGHSHTRHLTNPAEHDGVKHGTAYRGKCSGWGVAEYTGSNSTARKAASATIAKIPFVLARHIAWAWKPKGMNPLPQSSQKFSLEFTLDSPASKNRSMRVKHESDFVSGCSPKRRASHPSSKRVAGNNFSDTGGDAG